MKNLAAELGKYMPTRITHNTLEYNQIYNFMVYISLYIL